MVDSGGRGLYRRQPRANFCRAPTGRNRDLGPKPLPALAQLEREIGDPTFVVQLRTDILLSSRRRFSGSNLEAELERLICRQSKAGPRNHRVVGGQHEECLFELRTLPGRNSPPPLWAAMTTAEPFAAASDLAGEASMQKTQGPRC